MNENNTNINWYPGHMAKSKKQIQEDLKLVDVVVEVLDARIPISSKNPDVDGYARGKKRIIVLNKKDLADENVTNKWIEYYKKKSIPCIAVEASTGDNVKKIIPLILSEYKEDAMKYAEAGRTGKACRVIILGIPNVGKSTLINKLAGRKAQEVSNKPGVTRKNQWIRLEGIELLDTPGMLWPKLGDDNIARNLAYTNSIGINAIDTEEIAYYLLEYLVTNYPERINERYSVDVDNFDKDDMDYILNIREKVARNKGCIMSGNMINEQKVSDMIINDFRNGKLGKISIERPKEN